MFDCAREHKRDAKAEISKNWLYADVPSEWWGRLKAFVFGYRKRDFKCKRSEHYCIIYYIVQGKFPA